MLVPFPSIFSIFLQTQLKCRTNSLVQTVLLKEKVRLRGKAEISPSQRCKIRENFTLAKKPTEKSVIRVSIIMTSQRSSANSRGTASVVAPHHPIRSRLFSDAVPAAAQNPKTALRWHPLYLPHNGWGSWMTCIISSIAFATDAF